MTGAPLVSPFDDLDWFFDYLVQVFPSNPVAQIKSSDWAEVVETLNELVRNHRPVLNQWSERLLTGDPASPGYQALLTVWRRAGMASVQGALLAEVLTPISPETISTANRVWDQLCPDALARHLQSPPVTLSGDQKSTWLRAQGGNSWAVANMIAEGHPCWDARRQSQWAVALITGIGATSSAKRNKGFAQLLTTLLPQMTPEHWAQVAAKDLLPFWHSRWAKSGAIVAAWRAWKADQNASPIAASPSRARVRP